MPKLSQRICLAKEILSFFSPFIFPVVFFNANSFHSVHLEGHALHELSSFWCAVRVYSLFYSPVDTVLFHLHLAKMPVKWKYSNWLYFYWLIFPLEFLCECQRSCDCRISVHTSRVFLNSFGFNKEGWHA